MACEFWFGLYDKTTAAAPSPNNVNVFGFAHWPSQREGHCPMGRMRRSAHYMGKPNRMKITFINRNVVAITSYVCPIK